MRWTQTGAVMIFFIFLSTGFASAADYGIDRDPDGFIGSGDQIEISSWHIKPNATVTMHYTVCANGLCSLAVGKAMTQDTNTNYSAVIGPFEPGDRISYWIEFNWTDSNVSTSAMEFEVIHLDNVDHVNYDLFIAIGIAAVVIGAIVFGTRAMKRKTSPNSPNNDMDENI